MSATIKGSLASGTVWAIHKVTEAPNVSRFNQICALWQAENEELNLAIPTAGSKVYTVSYRTWDVSVDGSAQDSAKSQLNDALTSLVVTVTVRGTPLEYRMQGCSVDEDRSQILRNKLTGCPSDKLPFVWVDTADSKRIEFRNEESTK